MLEAECRLLKHLKRTAMYPTILGHISKGYGTSFLYTHLHVKASSPLRASMQGPPYHMLPSLGGSLKSWRKIHEHSMPASFMPVRPVTHEPHCQVHCQLGVECSLSYIRNSAFIQLFSRMGRCLMAFLNEVRKSIQDMKEDFKKAKHRET